jgi:hypothetical protein
LEKVARQRRAAARKLHAAQVRRQKKLLRELGVPDLSAEEVTERARAAQRRHVREAPAERPSVIRRPSGTLRLRFAWTLPVPNLARTRSIRALDQSSS